MHNRRAQSSLKLGATRGEAAAVGNEVVGPVDEHSGGNLVTNTDKRARYRVECNGFYNDIILH
jgi:hypothetical protein